MAPSQLERVVGLHDPRRPVLVVPASSSRLGRPLPIYRIVLCLPPQADRVVPALSSVLVVLSSSSFIGRAFLSLQLSRAFVFPQVDRAFLTYKIGSFLPYTSYRIVPSAWSTLVDRAFLIYKIRSHFPALDFLVAPSSSSVPPSRCVKVARAFLVSLTSVSSDTGRACCVFVKSRSFRTYRHCWVVAARIIVAVSTACQSCLHSLVPSVVCSNKSNLMLP